MAIDRTPLRGVLATLNSNYNLLVIAWSLYDNSTSDEEGD
jgi:hypothetical protein